MTPGKVTSEIRKPGIIIVVPFDRESVARLAIIERMANRCAIYAGVSILSADMVRYATRK